MFSIAKYDSKEIKYLADKISNKSLYNPFKFNNTQIRLKQLLTKYESNLVDINLHKSPTIMLRKVSRLDLRGFSSS